MIIESNLTKSLQLLEYFLASPQGLTIAEIQAKSDLSRSTVFNLLKNLRALGYIEQAGSRGKYYSGPKLQAWRNSPSDTDTEMIHRFNAEFPSGRIDETVLLSKLIGDAPVVIAQCESTKPIRYNLVAGSTAAHLISVATLLKDTGVPQLPLIQKSAEVIEMSVPICANGFTPTAALTIVAPAYRWNKKVFSEKFKELLTSAAQRISFHVGAPYYQPFNKPASAIPMEETLSQSEINEFLSKPLTARLGCVTPAGTPHVVPVWQNWDGKEFTILAWKNSSWSSYLDQNPQVSLTIDEPWPPMRRVVVKGVAQPLSLPVDLLAALTEKVAQQYLGQIPSSIPALQIEKAFRVSVSSMIGSKGLKVSQ